MCILDPFSLYFLDFLSSFHSAGHRRHRSRRCGSLIVYILRYFLVCCAFVSVPFLDIPIPSNPRFLPLLVDVVGVVVVLNV